MNIPPLHILIVAEPFAGKSTFCRTMPGPNLIFFFDAIGKDEPYLECGDVQTEHEGQPLVTAQGALMKRVWSREAEPRLLFQIEYYHDTEWKSGSTGGIEPNPVAYERFCKRLLDFESEFGYWATCCLDSYSGIQLASLLRQKYKLNPGSKYDKRHWAGATNDELQAIVFSFLAMLPMNVVVVMHEGFYEDKEGRVYRAPHTYGGIGYEMPRGFSEMYRLVREPISNRRYLQTQKDAIWNANSKYAPNPCEPSYQAVVASITEKA